MAQLLFHILVTIITLLTTEATFFPDSLDEPSLSIIYTRDKVSDVITQQCLKEMFPPKLYSYPLKIERGDVPCILHCVFKKFGVMDSYGKINLRNYYRRVETIHRHDRRLLISDIGNICADNVEKNYSDDNDLCRKAQAFNDCTQLYVIAMG